MCVWHESVAVPIMLLLAPVFDNFSTPAEDDFLESVVPGEYLVTLEPNTDCECHMVHNVVM